jgi:hypothetical protein
MPQRIFAYEMTVMHLNIVATLDAALPLVDCDVFKSCVVYGEQGPFTAKYFICNDIHNP